MPVGQCSCCGRKLTDEHSVAIGIGPICCNKIIEQHDPDSCAPDFSLDLVDDVLVVVDFDIGGASVTNSASSVFAAAVEQFGDKVPELILYRDSSGRWDAFDCKGRFLPVDGMDPSPSRDDALKRAKERYGDRVLAVGHQRSLFH